MEGKRKATKDEFPQPSRERSGDAAREWGREREWRSARRRGRSFLSGETPRCRRTSGTSGAPAPRDKPRCSSPDRSTSRFPEPPPPGTRPRRPPTAMCRRRSRRGPKRGARRAGSAGAASRGKHTPLESSCAMGNRTSTRRFHGGLSRSPPSKGHVPRLAVEDAAFAVASLDTDGRVGIRGLVGAPRGGQLA